MKKVIVVLEDNADRVSVMKEWLADCLSMYESFFSDDPNEVIDVLQKRSQSILALSLDHDLFERADGDLDRTGMEVVDYLSRGEPSFPILIHSSNQIEADRMKRRLAKHHWTVSRVTPFLDTSWIGTDWYPTLRKAIGRLAKKESKADVDKDVEE